MAHTQHVTNEGEETKSIRIQGPADEIPELLSQELSCTTP